MNAIAADIQQAPRRRGCLSPGAGGAEKYQAPMQHKLIMAPILSCPAEGRKPRTDRDAVELIGEALQSGATMMMLPMERLDGFFRLSIPPFGSATSRKMAFSYRSRHN
jgi:hypothetical protein